MKFPVEAEITNISLCLYWNSRYEPTLNLSSTESIIYVDYISLIINNNVDYTYKALFAVPTIKVKWINKMDAGMLKIDDEFAHAHDFPREMSVTSSNEHTYKLTTNSN